MKTLQNIILIIASLIIFSCEYGSQIDSDFSKGEGQGGSLARFTIANNYLYTVDQNSLKCFNLADAEKPVYSGSKPLNFGVETIFPLNQKLFIGTTTGMYIFNVSSPENPEMVSFFNHVRSCDPVVTDGNYAYVTLNSANVGCGRQVNELQVIDIKNLNSPELIKQFALESPKGLAVRNDSLWICDNGLKLLDISNKQSPRILHHFTEISASDIILNKNLALVIGPTGFVQYKIEKDMIKKLSEIQVVN